MNCPSCHRPVDHEAENCYSCGYSCDRAKLQFGSKQVVLNQIHDAADCLRVRESRLISDVFDHLEVHFPQLIFAVYLGELNETISISELGFWLLNHAEIEDSDVSNSNDRGILLLIDVERMRAGISLGYHSELLLSEEDCHRALMASRPFLINGEFGNGVEAVFKKIEKLLNKKYRQMDGLTREQKKIELLKSRGENSLALPEHHSPSQFEGGLEVETETEKEHISL